MTDKDQPRRIRGLRALRGSSPRADDDVEPGAGGRTDDDAAVGELDRALVSLEAKLAGQDGIDGLARWLREVEATVAALRNADLERTREDIRSVIDRLLSVNAEIQDIVRLKKLLS